MQGSCKIPLKIIVAGFPIDVYIVIAIPIPKPGLMASTLLFRQGYWPVVFMQITFKPI